MRAFVRTARETRFAVRRDGLFLRPKYPQQAHRSGKKAGAAM